MADSKSDDQEQSSDSWSEPRMLRETVDSLSVSLSDRIEWLAGELRSRWTKGDQVPVESLGSRFDQVAGNEEHLLDLIYHEMLIREEFGQSPQLDDFIRRFPEHSDRLQRLFAVHGALDEEWPEDFGADARDSESASSLPDQETTSDMPQSPEQDSGCRTPQWPRRSRDRRPVDPPAGYELLEEIGRGGMAVVYRARQQILDRIVAVKMLLSGNLAGPEVLARIRQEARAVAQLQHPGIVQIYEVGEHYGLPFLSLEFVPGGTLHDWLDGQPLPPLEAARLVEQLAHTVHFAHERGIVHRDLKPANVLLTERPARIEPGKNIPIEASKSGSLSPGMSFSLKISDFGLARVLDHGSELTATGQIIGTPSYMAPEQASGSDAEATSALDIYSLGAILYEFLTGRPPFRGATLFDTLEQVRSDEPVPPRRLQPRVPRDLETVCLKCLEKSPERRYATALALAKDLHAVQNGDSILARPAGRLERSWKLIRRYPAVTSLLLLTLTLAATGVTGILLENRRANQRESDARRERDIARESSRVARAAQIKAGELRAIAEQQTRKADEQALQALRDRALADDARAQAEDARQQAEANLEQAMAAIDSLARLGIRLRDTPQQQTTSRTILDETLKLYEQLEKNHNDSTRLRRQLASTLIRAGEIRSALRETEKASQLLQRSVKLLDEELERSPDDTWLLAMSAHANWVHGNLLNNTRRPAEAIVAYERCLAAHDATLKQKPNDAIPLKYKANAIINLCAALNQQRRFPESLLMYEDAIQSLRSVLQQFPNDRNSQSELALALHDYSRVVYLLKGYAPAEQAFSEALQIRQRLFETRPDDIPNRALYARLFFTSGLLLRQSRKYAESISQFRRVEELLAPAIASFPNVYEYQNDLQAAMRQEVETFLLMNDAAAGKPRWQELIQRLQAARSLFPTERSIASQLQELEKFWCEHLWEDGQKAEATRLWKALIADSLWLTSPASVSAELTLAPEVQSANAREAAWALTMSPDPSLRDLPKAITFARRSVDLAPSAAEPLLVLGAALYYSGDHRQAQEILQKAVAADVLTDQQSTLTSAGEALKALTRGNPFEAQQSVSAIVGLRGSSPERNPLLYAMLAMSQWQLGDHELARETLQTISEPAAGFTKAGPQIRRLLAEAKALIRAAEPR